MTQIARIGTAVVAASLALGLAYNTFAADPPKPGTTAVPGQPGVPATAAAPGKEVPAGAVLPKDRVTPTKDLQAGVRGSVGRKLTGREAGLPLSDFPGAKSISSAEWKQMREIPKTGLYIVDADYVPGNFRQSLKQEGYSYGANGEIKDRKGNSKAIFILPQTYEMKGQRQGFLEKVQKYAGDAIVGEAKAGNPYWFACYSADAWLVYSNGFCRYWDLKTKGWAYGPKAGGGCGWPVPATKISTIQVWAWIHGHAFKSASCANCSSKGVTASWDIGCFWPAYGGATLENYANLQDNDPAHGNPRADAYWVWSP